MKNRFIGIALNDYIEKHVRANPGVSRADIKARREFAVAAHEAGKRCSCGAEIWIVGSAEAGLSCFTCITGESDPSEDYEIAIRHARAYPAFQRTYPGGGQLCIHRAASAPACAPYFK